MTADSVNTSRLFEHLPAIFQEADAADAQRSLNALLLAFEAVLFSGAVLDIAGAAGFGLRGLGDEIASLHAIVEPLHTPENFLPWLASWVALEFRADLPVERRRRLLAQIVPLYLIRGTRRYVQQLLKLHLPGMASVIEEETGELEIGRHSTIGSDTWLGGRPPHFFRIVVAFPSIDEWERERWSEVARAVADLAKPAHTVYSLEIISPRFQIGVHSRVGVDTVFGS